MNDNGKEFDPYQKWLKIPAEELPPNHYALLGLPKFETELAKIDEASMRRSGYLHQMASGPNRPIVQKLLGEIATARRVLLNEATKRDYDASLRVASQPQAVEARPRTPNQQPPQPPGISQTPSLQVASNKRAKRKTRRTNRLLLYAAMVAMLLGAIYFLANGRQTPQNSSSMALKPSVRVSKEQLAKKRARVFDSLVQSTQKSTSEASPRPQEQSRNSKPSQQASPATLVRIQEQPAWIMTVPQSNVFENDAMSPFVSSDQIGKRWRIAEQRMELIPSPSAKTVLRQEFRDWRLVPGRALSLRTNFPVAFDSGLRLGIQLQRLTLLLEPVKVKNQRYLALKVNGKQVALLEKLGSGPLVMTVYRSEAASDNFLCVIQYRDQIQAGWLRVPNVGNEMKITLIHRGPQKKTGESIWIDSPRFGRPKQSPEDPSAEPLEIKL